MVMEQKLYVLIHRQQSETKTLCVEGAFVTSEPTTMAHLLQGHSLFLILPKQFLHQLESIIQMYESMDTILIQTTRSVKQKQGVLHEYA